MKFIFAIGGSLFVLFFLWSFGPFGIVFFSNNVKLKLLTTICISGAIILIIHVYLLQKILFKKFTIGSTIIWFAWMTLMICISNFIIWGVMMNNSHMVWKYWYRALYQTYMVGLLPIIFIVILYNNYFLKKKIKFTNQINADLSKYQSEILGKFDITLTSINLREVLTIDSNSLLYIVSSDNYVEIHWLENGQARKSLLRKTLAETEKDIKRQCRNVERCHNSYIVNINQIKNISGNSGGYSIILNNIDFAIPVSRKYKNSFFKPMTSNTL